MANTGHCLQLVCPTMARMPMETHRMRFSVLALDYDGTIAHEAVLDPEVRQAIREV